MVSLANSLLTSRSSGQLRTTWPLLLPRRGVILASSRAILASSRVIPIGPPPIEDDARTDHVGPGLPPAHQGADDRSIGKRGQHGQLPGQAAPPGSSGSWDVYNKKKEEQMAAAIRQHCDQDRAASVGPTGGKGRGPGVLGKTPRT